MPVEMLQHVNIRTTQLERSREFYERIVGLRVGDRPPIESVGYWLYAGAEPVIHLVQVDQAAVEPGTGAVDHVAFKGVDLQTTRQTLVAGGVPFRETVIPRNNLTQLFLHDPDGVKIEINFEPTGGAP
jgi:catechol 2,3-dioxygenase-like lactoylglutathione lyase family enzyme